MSERDVGASPWREPLALHLLETLAAPSAQDEAVGQVVRAVQEQTRIAAVGVRLPHGDDYPFLCSAGQPPEFLLQESSLCRYDPAGELRLDDQGRPALACLCGRVLRGETKAAAGCFTAGGSFFTPYLQQLAAGGQLGPVRGRCVAAGFETFALVPLRRDGAIVGLLYLADPRAAILSDDDLPFLERLGTSIGAALLQRGAQAVQRRTEETYRGLFEKLRWGYAQHRMIFEQSGAAVDYVTLEANRAFEEILQVPRDAVIGKPASAILPPAELARWLAVFGGVAQGGPPQDYELYSAHNDRHFRGHVFCPTLGFFSVAFEDVTERSRAARQLAASETKFRTVANYTYDWELWIEPDGQLAFCSPSCERITGYTAADFLADPDLLGSLIHPDDRAAVGHQYSAHLTDRSTTYELDFRIRTRAGEERWLAHICRPVVTPEGDYLGRRVSNRDITEHKQAEDSLRASEQKYHRLFDTMADGVFVLSADGRLTDANRAALEIFGISGEDLAARTSLEPRSRVVREDGTELPRELHPSTVALRTGQPVRDAIVRIFNPRRDDFIWVRVNAVPETRPGDDRPHQVFVTLHEISDQMRAMDALRESEERFQKAFQAAPVLLALSQIDDGRYVEVNDQFCATTGLSRDEALGKTSVELGLISAEQRQHLVDEMSRSGRVRDFELALQARDGRTITCLCAFELLGVGARPLLLSIATDVSDRVQAHEALRASEERFRTLADTLPQTIFEADLSGRVSYANRAGFETFGYSAEELSGGLDIGQLIVPSDGDRASAMTAQVLAGTPSAGHEYTARRKDGETFPVLVYSSPTTRDGEVIRLRGVVVDIRESRRAEQERSRLQAQLAQAQKMESIGALAGGLAHDFNNLLGGILGGLSLMEEDLDPEQRDLLAELGEMKALVGRGAELTRQLLGFARRRVGNPRPLDLNLELERTARMFGHTRKDLALGLELAEDLPAVLADPTQLEQLVLNLLLNAGQAMPDGGELNLRTEIAEVGATEAGVHGLAPGRFARLVVADTGVGMDAETRDRIFEPFFTTRETRGSGLGLASVYGIITSHRGFITVDSELGKGCTFAVYLPTTPRQVDQAPREAMAPQRGRETILLVDDEEAFASICRRMLERLGYEVLVARSGSEALELFGASPGRIALVVLDLVMPGMTGIKTYEELRAIAPEVKILLASGRSSEAQLLQDLEAGCGFIQKPFDLTELSHKLRALLR